MGLSLSEIIIHCSAQILGLYILTRLQVQHLQESRASGMEARLAAQDPILCGCVSLVPRPSSMTPSLMPTPRGPPGEKRSGERSRIS